MPRKTKKEKKIADFRRKLKQQEIHKSINQLNIQSSVQKKEIINLESNSNLYFQADQDKLMAEFTVADLRKTIILTSILFTLEFSIFYAMLLR